MVLEKKDTTAFLYHWLIFLLLYLQDNPENSLFPHNKLASNFLYFTPLHIYGFYITMTLDTVTQLTFVCLFEQYRHCIHTF